MKLHTLPNGVLRTRLSNSAFICTALREGVSEGVWLLVAGVVQADQAACPSPRGEGPIGVGLPQQATSEGRCIRQVSTTISDRVALACIETGPYLL